MVTYIIEEVMEPVALVQNWMTGQSYQEDLGTREQDITPPPRPHPKKTPPLVLAVVLKGIQYLLL